MEHLLETRKLTKVFGGVAANRDVDFWCDAGQVVSLLGENGAGKTTLMKMIYGMQEPDGGEILFEGKPVRFRNPKDAIACGIQMVHQHFMLIEEMTAAENIVMGMEPVRGLFYDKAQAERKILELSDAYRFGIDPKARIQNLSVGEKQKVEILKALYRGAKLLILDEPTAVLTPQETEGLFEVIRRLKADGRSIIIITHKLHETMEIADLIFVLRHGVMTGSVWKKETDIRSLTKMMVNHELKKFEKTPPVPGGCALELQEVCCHAESGAQALDRLSLSVCGGEIYGVAGIEGNGQTELLEVISGIRRASAGQIFLYGEEVTRKTNREITAMGAAFVHSDRTDRGLLLDKNAALNLLLGNQYGGLMGSRNRIDYKKTDALLGGIMETYEVTPKDRQMPLRSFSGGNQQKLIIGRELLRKPRLAVFAHPTRGVDIGVSEIIHQRILELKLAGAAVLLITADMDELFMLSDRIGVIYEGRMAAEDQAEAFTPERLGLYMGGGGE